MLRTLLSTAIAILLLVTMACSPAAAPAPAVAEQAGSRGASGRLGPGPYSLAADDAAGTFTFTTQKPFTDAIYNFTTWYGFIVCPAGLANPDALATTPRGSGPYLFEEAVPGDHVTVKLR